MTTTKNTRNLLRALGVSAVVALAGFGFTGCDTPGGYGNGNGYTNGGNGHTYHTITFNANGGDPSAPQILENIRSGTRLNLAGHLAGPVDKITLPAEGMALPTRAHDTPLTRAWTFGWAEDPDAAATLSYIVVTRDVTLYAVWRDVELRFWWGNYIPAYGPTEWGGEWEVILNDPEWGDNMGSFNLDELIAERANSRLVGKFTGPVYYDGAYYEVNAPGRSEGKHTYAAVRKVFPDYKSHIFNPTFGFHFFIYPTSFGQVNILESVLGQNVNHLFAFPVVYIDGVSYTVAHWNNAPVLVDANIVWRFQWN